MKIISLFITIFLLSSCSTTTSSQKVFIEEKSNTKFIRITAGKFLMGSEYYKEAPANEQQYFIDESPIHEIQITEDVWVSENEVTVGQFRRFVSETSYVTDAEKNGESLGQYVVTVGTDGKPSGSWTMGKSLSWHSPGFEINESQPVVHVSWNDSIAYCNWLNSKTGLTFRLLTEAEWEYAASGKQQILYSWGNGFPNTDAGGNIADTSFIKAFPQWKYAVYDAYNDGHIYPATVKSYAPNPNGLFDMTGNVWEWCNDFYNKEYYKNSPTENPKGPENGEEHTIRGGGFDWELSYLRIPKRRRIAPNKSACNIGFRISTNSVP